MQAHNCVNIVLTLPYHMGCSEGDILVDRAWGEAHGEIDFHHPLEVGGHALEDTGAAYLHVYVK